MAHEAIESFERMVAEELADMLQRGARLPPSLTDRRYSGNFMVRTSSALHSKLMVEACEQGVSLNQWVVQKLAGRPMTLDGLF
jgi:predicted HicB family RNase H-like nuclease